MNMKIKTWLLLSYFLVMILPVIATYVLFLFIQGYNDELKVKEHVETVAEIASLKKLLADPALYKPNSNWNKIQQAVDSNESVVLLNKDGIVIFASHSSVASTFMNYGKEQLYDGLYELQQGYRSYTYRQPVFIQDEIVGFFDIQIPREQWVKGVANRAILIGGGLIIMFVLVYAMVIILLNKKLLRPLHMLMHDMNKFAAEETVEERSTKPDEMGILTKQFYAMRRQINMARDTAKQEQQAKEFIVASVSHDLKTPLTSIKAYAESLVYEKNIEANEQQEYLHIIMEKTDFLKAMLDDLLTYTMLHSAEHSMDFVSVEGEEFFDMLISDYEALCKQKGVVLHVDLQITGEYKVDPNQMIRVMDNLVSNAISHTAPNGRIWLGAMSDDLPDWTYSFVQESLDCRKKEQGALLIVQNEGKGIDAELLPHVFEPFYQKNEARNKSELQKTGLGLSIAKQIIEKHGGWITIFSQENVGTCVVCMLPKTKER